MLRFLVKSVLFWSLATAATAQGSIQFKPNNLLVFPADYRDWVFLTSSLDMTYDAGAGAAGHSMFDNVFVNPEAWRAFKKSGHWPTGTIFAKEVRGAKTEGSIAKGGKFQDDAVMQLEVHLRDDARFKGGWAFFVFADNTPALPIQSEASCYSCHEAHGAVDTTFTQFYPTGKAIALKLGSFDQSR
jgi:hypothetical protein